MDWRMLIATICGLLLLTLDFLDAKDVKSLSNSLTLQCPECSKIHCTPKRAKRLKCKGGITRGICNCCPVCAKTEGESCGGEWDYLGKCDRGLFCHPNSGQIKDKTPEGKCKRDPTALGDQGKPSYCKPRCTPDYCQENPKAICSAFDNADRTQKCQGDCQHTSCSACRFVKEDYDCVKCRKDDFDCMRTFAKCIKQTYCTRQKYPCKKSAKETPGAKFQCLVAECVAP